MKQNTDDDREQRALRIAKELFAQQPDWITFFREVMGVDGLLRQLFTSEELAAFEQTPAYAAIQEMLATLRAKAARTENGKEPTRVITVRLPESLHKALIMEAHDRHTSMNQLCITKLLATADVEAAA